MLNFRSELEQEALPSEYFNIRLQPSLSMVDKAVGELEAVVGVLGVLSCLAPTVLASLSRRRRRSGPSQCVLQRNQARK